VLTAATEREETRGAHDRRDHPAQSESWRRRIVHLGGGRTWVTGVVPTRPAAPVADAPEP
jgi:succinate dehydrogenase/fumarate reductase flavoprotein subunit